MPRQPQINRSKLTELWRKGKTQREIAQLLNVTDSSVHKALIRFGLKRKENKRQIVRKADLGRASAEQADRAVSRGFDAIEEILSANRGVRKIIAKVLDKDGNPMLKKKEQSFIIALKAWDQVVSQVVAVSKLLSQIYEMKNIEAMLDEIVSVVASMSPEAANEIVRRLEARRIRLIPGHPTKSASEASEQETEDFEA